MSDESTETEQKAPDAVLTAKDLVRDWTREDGKKTPRNAKERAAKADVIRRQNAVQTIIDRNAELEEENRRLNGQVNDFKSNRAVERRLLDAANRLPTQLLYYCAAAARVCGQLQVLSGEEGKHTFGLNAGETLKGTIVNRLGTFTMTLSGQGSFLTGTLEVDPVNRRKVPVLDLDGDGLLPGDELILARLLEVDNDLVTARARKRFLPGGGPTDTASAATKAVRAAIKRMNPGPQNINFWTSPFDLPACPAPHAFYMGGGFVHLDGPTMTAGGEVPR